MNVSSNLPYNTYDPLVIRMAVYKHCCGWPMLLFTNVITFESLTQCKKRDILMFIGVFSAIICWNQVQIIQ